MDFYAVLGVARDADEEKIRTAYHALARQYHPDRCIGSSSDRFRLIKEAYDTLISPESRRTYDKSLGPGILTVQIADRGPLPQENPAVFGYFFEEAYFSEDDWLAVWLRGKSSKE